MASLDNSPELKEPAPFYPNSWGEQKGAAVCQSSTRLALLQLQNQKKENTRPAALRNADAKHEQMQHRNGPEVTAKMQGCCRGPSQPSCTTQQQEEEGLQS